MQVMIEWVVTYGNIKSICKVKLSRQLESDGDLWIQLGTYSCNPRYLLTVRQCTMSGWCGKYACLEWSEVNDW